MAEAVAGHDMAAETVRGATGVVVTVVGVEVVVGRAEAGGTFFTVVV